MKKSLKFSRSYFILAVLLFVIEVLIAKYAHDRIIRSYVGDVLVVILIYCTVKSFLDTPVLPTALWVLLFSFTIEGLQYVDIVTRLGLQRSKLATIIMGNSFAWIDIAAYFIGIVIVLLFEKGSFARNLMWNDKI